MALDPREITLSLFKGSYSCLNLTGTVNPYVFNNLTGLNYKFKNSTNGTSNNSNSGVKGYTEILANSPFKSRNIKALITEGINTGRDSRTPATYKKMIDSILEVVENTPGNVGVFCDFFSITEATNLFPSDFKETGWMAAYRTGLYVDNLKQNLWDTYVQHPEVFPSEVDDLYSWSRTTFETIQGEGNDRSTYFANIQHCLNVAVLHCALAIDLALDSNTDCSCQGESQSIPDIQVYQNLIEQQIFAYFLITGCTSVFISLGALLIGKSKLF